VSSPPSRRWEQAVRDAGPSELGALFAELREAVGTAEASRIWLAAFAATDTPET